MRVDLRTHGIGPAEEKKTERATAPSADRPAGDAAALDKARFYFDHARVKALEAEVLARPEIRQEKVDLLRQAIGKGEYAVNEGQIADAIIADISPGSAGQPKV